MWRTGFFLKGVSMLDFILKKVIGSKNDRDLKRLSLFLEEINALEPAMMALSDDELTAKTPYFRDKLAKGAELDDILAEAFAVAREADGQYRLKWDRNPAKDLRYYNVYFSTQGKCEVGQKRLIISPPGSTKEYLDWTAPLGVQSVYYAITAVDRQGNESPPAHASVGK